MKASYVEMVYRRHSGEPFSSALLLFGPIRRPLGTRRFPIGLAKLIGNTEYSGNTSGTGGTKLGWSSKKRQGKLKASQSMYLLRKCPTSWPWRSVCRQREPGTRPATPPDATTSGARCSLMRMGALWLGGGRVVAKWAWEGQHGDGLGSARGVSLSGDGCG